MPSESQSKSNRLLVDKQCQATPKKRALNEEPVTPNANFKLLTSLAAAQEYANCSAPKKLKDESCSNDGLVLFDNRICYDSDIPLNPPSRKEKSLSLICTRFLDMYPIYPNIKEPIVVSLDEACTKLGIERRRLYDIVNVFESISMLAKQAKNQYLWYGKNYLIKALKKLKSGAIKENTLEKLQYVLEFEDSVLETKATCILAEVQDFNLTFETRKASSETPEVLRYPSPIPEMRKEKSLTLMSQKFLMLFLVSPAKVISLSVAAKVLNGFQGSDKIAQVKTQIRRLYDIANVLSSIGLIQKEVTIDQNGRKPAFRYIGPDLDAGSGTPTKVIPRHKSCSEPPKIKPKSLVRHSSFQEICAVAEMERNKIYELPNSAPPFQKTFKNENTTPAKTSFSNLVIDLEAEDSKESSPISSKLKDPKESPISSHLKDLKTLPLLQKTKSVNLDSGTKKTQAPLRSISLPRQSSFKLVNMPNGPYYIVNSATREIKKSPTPMGTVLLISPLSIKSAKKEVVPEKAPEKKVFNTRTLQLSAEQRDTILKTLNLSLSDGQIAAIQLEGSSNSTDTDIKPRCNLLKIIEKHEQSAPKANGNEVPPNQVAETKNANLLNVITTHKLSTSDANGNSNQVPTNQLIKLDTESSVPNNSGNKNDKLQKIIKELELRVSESKGNSNCIPPKNVIKMEDIESSELSPCSTTNASPNSCSSQLDSPSCDRVTASLCLKSVNLSLTTNGCTRNVENTEAASGKNTHNSNTCFKNTSPEEKKGPGNDVLSENSLISNKDEETVMKKVDRSDTTEPLDTSSYFRHFKFGGKQPISQKSRIQYLITGGKRKREDMSPITKVTFPLKEIINLSSTSNSDSLNIEVPSEKNKKNNSHVKSIIIEETIISPIKKNKGPLSTKPLSPTYFTTPPYTTHDTLFEFNSLPLKRINGKANSFSLSEETVNAACKVEK
ncbi:hypothetical protein JTE90_014141 [Oedothorax gibbosus]|uniref:E2F/DP family winged-helix DNA-binding domain-containing protein n=1 Tax=Oedothorax gibbosus TaxID=931172 RepID=A0AAV6VKK4_9ARAC|nr:hypothetical protein JTE90_014141 [Oedothorax gibbosus]